MFNYSEKLTNLQFETSEEIWLKAEHFQRAKEVSDRVSDESKQWQIYLNTLALLGFEEWIKERSSQQINLDIKWIKERSSQQINLDINSATRIFGNLKLGQFKLGAIATDNLFDEVVYIPEEAISNHELAAHFYVVLEVLEELEQVIVRGFLRYDELLDYPTRGSIRDGCYQIPLSKLTLEPNRLLFYCRYLEPSTIPLPETPVVGELAREMKETTIKLSQWLEGLFDEAWQSIDRLIDPGANLALATKSISNSSSTNLLNEIERGKLINLGLQLEDEIIALRVTISKESEEKVSIKDTEEKVSIKVRLDPTGRAKYLPSALKLAMLSKKGKIIQEVTSRTRDNYIQLRPFKGKFGKRFSLEISRNDVVVKEHFEI